jgi:hypothetical protein
VIDCCGLSAGFLFVIFILIESIFPRGGIVLQHLLAWVKWHCDTADKLAKEVADSAEPVENHNYWSAVCCPLFYICSRVQ